MKRTLKTRQGAWPRRLLAEAAQSVGAALPRPVQISQTRFAARVGIWVVGLMFVGAPGMAQAQTETVDKEAWKQGFQGLAMLCRGAGFEICEDSEQWAEVIPRNSAVIVLGRTYPMQLNFESYVRGGGAVLVASDRDDSGVFRNFGVRLFAGPQQVARSRDGYQGNKDCPIVSVESEAHAVLEGVSRLVTNRPGSMLDSSIASTRSRRYQRLARLPDSVRLRRFSSGPPLFAAVSERRRNSGRVLFVADQSVFTNQMLVCGDNARFAANVVAWLKEGGRDRILILADQEMIQPKNPSAVDLEIPPPTKEQVLAMLRSLPPDVLLDFGNEVATLMEDEGFLNELARFVVETIPGFIYRRLLILVPTIILALLAFNRLRRNPVTDLSQVTSPGQVPAEVMAASERRMAVGELLDQFRVDLSGDATTPWQSFLWSVNVKGGGGKTRELQKEIRQLTRRFENKPVAYWNSKRLEQAVDQIRHWRQLHADGILQYDGVVSTSELESPVQPSWN